MLSKIKTKLGNFKETARRSKYAHYYKDYDIEDNIILYDSYFSRGMLCNPYAIFRELISNSEFYKYTHVWVVDDRVGNEPVMEQFADHDNIYVIRRHSNDHLKYLATAHYIISNVSLPFYYCKKPGQIFVNTWHGTPIKSLGYDIPGSAATISNVLRNMLSADYMISANPFLTEVYLDKYKLRGLYNGSIIEEGYPRNDRLLNCPKEEIKSILLKYGIELEKDKQVILYAPTWKGADYNKPEVNPDDYYNFKRELEEYIDTDKYQILLKPHQVVYKELVKSGMFSNSLIPAFIDTNELLSITDILISDYSSIFFDFLASDKPVLFYIPDLEEYKNYRGLYMEPDKLPGPALTSVKEIGNSINNLGEVINKYKDSYSQAKNFACPYDDGNVSSRIVDIVFRGNTSDSNGNPYRIIKCENTKKKLLFFGGGLRMNGISTALRTMLDFIDYDKYDVTVYAGNLKFADSKDMICTFNDNARIFARVSYTPATFGEQIRNDFLRVFGFNFPLMKKIYPKAMYDREFIRCFGTSDFDAVIDYSGYGSFYSILLLSAKNAKKLIWQHNDLLTDKNKIVNHKKPHSRELRVVFSTYQFYDKIVGCSEATMKVNLEKIGYSELKDKCCFVRNAANFERVINGSKESYTAESANEAGFPDLLNKDLISFVNMGRLSPEKNQAALIKAFAKAYDANKNLRLYIIGDGALMGELKDLVHSLNLDGKVILTGNLDNPFMLMKDCSCFILPSLHEGQPVSLLEARLLKLPIIMSNFSSAASSLFDNGQLVIGNSIDDIYNGLIAFINNEVPTCEFEYADYNNITIKQFEDIINE
ncbi:CDP-glycerol glycerophosphotransferase family protein [Eubacterium sp.]|uniref:CDP-glycerol glycerophosphotransferase family protein n=1 Tax=Eubacterium sp. TaxID=142586 RepID=UPI003521FD0B